MALNTAPPPQAPRVLWGRSLRHYFVAIFGYIFVSIFGYIFVAIFRVSAWGLVRELRPLKELAGVLFDAPRLEEPWIEE